MSVLNRLTNKEINNLSKVTKQKVTFSLRKYKTNNEISLPPIETKGGVTPLIYYEISKTITYRYYYFMSKYIEDYGILLKFKNNAARVCNEGIKNKDYHGEIKQPDILKAIKDVIKHQCFLYDKYDDIYYPAGEVFINFYVTYISYENARINEVNTDRPLVGGNGFYDSEEDENYEPFYPDGIPPDSEDEVNQNKNKSFKSNQCIICIEKQPNMLFCSCGHLCMCNTCFEAYNKNQCPECKTKNVNIREI